VEIKPGGTRPAVDNYKGRHAAMKPENLQRLARRGMPFGKWLALIQALDHKGFLRIAGFNRTVVIWRKIMQYSLN
jgi:hypothetical protein